jgi:hypothetical protein
VALWLAETQEALIEEARSFSSGKYKHDYKRSFSGGHF